MVNQPDQATMGGGGTVGSPGLPAGIAAITPGGGGTVGSPGLPAGMDAITPGGGGTVGRPGLPAGIAAITPGGGGSFGSPGLPAGIAAITAGGGGAVGSPGLPAGMDALAVHAPATNNTRRASLNILNERALIIFLFSQAYRHPAINCCRCRVPQLGDSRYPKSVIRKISFR
jgi:hypothetical protein